MNNLEKIMKYKIGIEMGLLSLEDLDLFLNQESANLDEIPDIYLEVLDHIFKGEKEVLNAIANYCFYNHLSLNERGKKLIKQDLLKIIKDRYFATKDLKNCCHYMYKLSLFIEDYYNLSLMGITYSEKEIVKMLENIFKKNNII